MRFVPLALGLVILWFVAAHYGVRNILGMLAEVRWALVFVLGLYAGHQMTRAAALMLCVPARTAFSFADALSIRLSGEAVEFLTFTGPLLSEPAKARLLQRTGLQLKEGLAATLSEYLASTIAAATTAIAGVGYVLACLHPVGPVRTAAIIVLVSMSAFLGCLAVVAPGRLRLVRERRGRFAVIMLAEFAAQGFLAVELWTLLVSVHLPCSLLQAAVMEGVIKFINAAGFFVPGQLGVAEGSYAVIFGVFGLPAVAGVTLSFARHVRTFVTALVGLAALTVLQGPERSRLDADARLT
jgi:hypothetical protein